MYEKFLEIIGAYGANKLIQKLAGYFTRLFDKCPGFSKFSVDIDIPYQFLKRKSLGNITQDEV